MKRTTRNLRRPNDTGEGVEEQEVEGQEVEQQEEEKWRTEAWPPAWMDMLFWIFDIPLRIIGDFDWRRKIRLQHRRPVQFYSREPVDSITPVHDFPLQLLADGTIRFDKPQSRGRLPRTKTYKHSNVFDIYFDDEYKKENRIRTKKPIVSSDGRYLSIRTLKGDVQAIITYKNGLWLEWFEPTAEANYFSLLLAGLATYRQMGDEFLGIVFNVVVVLLAIVLFFAVLFSL